MGLSPRQVGLLQQSDFLFLPSELWAKMHQDLWEYSHVFYKQTSIISLSGSTKGIQLPCVTNMVGLPFGAPNVKL